LYAGGATSSQRWEHGGQLWLWLTRDELHCRFKAKFGLGWEEALAKGVVFNAMDACSEVHPTCCNPPAPEYSVRAASVSAEHQGEQSLKLSGDG
jgi:hypothetical protein